MKLKVPFYPNTSDNTHCYQAIVRSVLKYFLPDKEHSLKELEEFTAKKEGKWTWPTQALINLHNMGFDVKRKTTFDYEKFVKEGGDYLIKKYGEEFGKAQIKNSDIEQERQLAKKYVSIFGNKPQRPTLKELKELINKDYLVVANVNYYSLYAEKGYWGHFVIILNIGDKHVRLHDPGLPPNPNVKISLKNFRKAWEYPDKDSRNYQVFRYRQDN